MFGFDTLAVYSSDPIGEEAVVVVNVTIDDDTMLIHRKKVWVDNRQTYTVDESVENVIDCPGCPVDE